MTNGEKLKEIFPNTKIITQYDNPFGDRFMVFTLNNEDMQVNINWWNAEYKEPTTKNDLALIHTEGLDEEIRCTMCTNSMKSDRGCDGSCVVDKDMYKAVMDAIEKRIQPTAKNDLPHCQHTDAEISKSFIEDVEAVKDQLPCGQMMDFPNTFDEFVNEYGFKDKQEVYTNGSELIQVFRVKQWLEHISTTKNDLGVDCIRRSDIALTDFEIVMCDGDYKEALKMLLDKIEKAPPVTPIRPKGHWIWEVDETPSTPISPYELNYAGWVCSCCHEFPDDICEWDNPDEPPTYKFCPNCGSDNREVEK